MPPERGLAKMQPDSVRCLVVGALDLFQLESGRPGIAAAGQNDASHRVVRLDAIEAIHHVLHGANAQRIAELRRIECDDGNAILDLETNMFVSGYAHCPSLASAEKFSDDALNSASRPVQY